MIENIDTRNHNCRKCGKECDCIATSGCYDCWDCEEGVSDSEGFIDLSEFSEFKNLCCHCIMPLSLEQLEKRKCNHCDKDVDVNTMTVVDDKCYHCGYPIKYRIDTTKGNDCIGFALCFREECGAID